MAQFPIYILNVGSELRIMFPEDRDDISHTEFWERTVAHVVAKHYSIPARLLANLPYCQRRGRIVQNTVFLGTRHPDAKLMSRVREAVGNDSLVFVYDEHERRLREDVREFRRLVRRFSGKLD